MQEYEIKNYTPCPVSVRFFRDGGMETITFPSLGVALLREEQRLIEKINGIPIYRTEYKGITGLPDPVVDVYLIVPMLVAKASCRKDLLSPDSGPNCIRDDTGRISAVQGLLSW